FFFFFFSSRRRHTRWPRDWSSDVCSSDLLLAFDVEELFGEVFAFHDCLSRLGDAYGRVRRRTRLDDARPHHRHVARIVSAAVHRSEERRVGKEGRSWWGAGQIKYKDRDLR